MDRLRLRLIRFFIQSGAITLVKWFQLVDPWLTRRRMYWTSIDDRCRSAFRVNYIWVAFRWGGVTTMILSRAPSGLSLTILAGRRTLLFSGQGTRFDY